MSGGNSALGGFNGVSIITFVSTNESVSVLSIVSFSSVGYSSKTYHYSSPLYLLEHSTFKSNPRR